jgi:hypothetical protein
MHAPVNRMALASLQEAQVSTAEKFSPAKTRRNAQRSSKPKRALGPMTEAARLRVTDWLLHQVGARKAERPLAYTAIALTFVMHFNDSDGKAYPSLETLATLTGIAKRTAREMIELHLADGNIRIVEKGLQGRGHSTTYAIVIRPLPDDVAEARRRVALREDRRKRNSGELPTLGSFTLDADAPQKVEGGADLRVAFENAPRGLGPT